MRDRVVRKFDSFEEADRADKAYYLSLTPAQRFETQAELCALAYGYKNDPPPRLEAAYKDQSFRMVFLKVDPRFDPIHGDPRYQDLLRRMHLAP